MESSTFSCRVKPTGINLGVENLEEKIMTMEVERRWNRGDGQAEEGRGEGVVYLFVFLN